MDEARERAAVRFGGFALGHFGLSLACTSLLFALLIGWMIAEPQVPALSARWKLWGAWLLAVLLLAAYYPVGYCVARSREWPRAEGRERLLAVLLPALVAWAWGGLGTGLLVLWEHPAALPGAWILVAGAFFLALPSWYFMALCLVCGIFSPTPQGGAWVQLVICLFLAGLLPPLIFHLGAQRATRAEPCSGKAGEKGDRP